VTQAPKQDVDQLARAYAENMRAQERERERLAQIESAGRKEFGAEFDSAVQNLNAAGVGGPEFLKVIAEVPNAEKVVAWLGKHDNLEEAIRIASLNPIQMGIEMTKLADKAAKALTKQVSKAPAPVQHIEGGSSASDQVEPAVGSKEWFDWRNKNARKRR
jgi:DNA-binding NtrC family response regulator